MSRAKRIFILGAAGVSGACVLACIAYALLVARYQPAVVAAPGYDMLWTTRPGLWAGLVKSYERFFERRTCDYVVLGWSPAGTLYYQEACRDDGPQVWAYDPEPGARPARVEAPPPDLLQQIVPRRSILESVRSPLVYPADAEPAVRELGVRVDGLASPDGHWVAVVVRHVYGPEDVIVVSN